MNVHASIKTQLGSLYSLISMRVQGLSQSIASLVGTRPESTETSPGILFSTSTWFMDLGWLRVTNGNTHYHKES